MVPPSPWVVVGMFVLFLVLLYGMFVVAMEALKARNVDRHHPHRE
jgi:hypothetical protein